MPTSSGVTGLRADYSRRLEASFSSVGTPLVSLSHVERALLQMGLVVSEERLISCVNEVHDYCFASVFLYIFEVCGTDHADISMVGLAALQQHMPIDLFPFLLLRDQPDEQLSSTKQSSPPPPQSVAASLVPPTLRSLFIKLQPSVVGSGQMEATRFSRPLTCAEYAMVVRCVVDSMDAEFNSFAAKEYVCSGPEGDYALGNVFQGICAALEGDLFAEEDAGDATGEDTKGEGGGAFSGAELIKFLKKFSIDVSEQGTLRSASTLSGSHAEPATSPFRRKSSFGDIASIMTRRKSVATMKRLSVTSPTTDQQVPDASFLEGSPSSSWNRLRATSSVTSVPATSGPPKLSQMQGADLTRMLVGTLLGHEALQQEGVYKGRDRLKQVTLQRIEDVRAQAASREMLTQLQDVPPGIGSPRLDASQPKPSAMRKRLSASLLSRSGMPDPDRPRLTRTTILGQLPSEIRPSDVAGNGPASPTMSPHQSMRLPNSKSFLTAITLLSRAGSSAKLKRQPSMGGGGLHQAVPAAVMPRVPTPRGLVDHLAGEDYQERCREAVVDARAARDDAFLLDSYLTLEPYHPFADRFNDPPEEGADADSPTRTHRRAEEEFRSLGVLPPTTSADVFEDTPINEMSRCGLDELERKVEKMFEMDTKAEALARKRDVDRLLHTSEKVRSSLRSREAASTQARKERLQWMGDVSAMEDKAGAVSGRSALWAKLKYGVYAHPAGMDADSPLPQQQLPALQDSGTKRSPTTEDAPASRPAPMSHWMVQQVHRGRTFLSSEVPVNPEEYRKRSNYLLDLQQHKAVQASRARTPSTRSHNHNVSSTPTRVRYSAEATPLRLPTANRSSAGRPQTSNSSTFGMVSPTPLPALTEDEEGAIDEEVSAMLAISQSPPPSRQGVGARGPTARALVPDDVVHVAHHKARDLRINLIPPEDDGDPQQPQRGDGKKKKVKSQASLAARKLIKKKKMEKKREEESLLVEWALRRRRDGFKA